MLRFVLWGGTLVAMILVAGNATAADAVVGKSKAVICTACHRLNGIAKNPDAPNLAGDNADYIIRQLHAFQSGARKHDQMTIIAKGLSEQDVANVAACIPA